MNRWLLQVLVTMLTALAALDAASQTTAFTYQGRLTENSSPANGAFQMQFKLFDALSGGSQIGATADNVPVSVAQGIFTTVLDFGAAPLTGADRWLEIGVRHNSGESYTTIAPREQISAAPYAVRTLSAAMADDSQKLGGVSASQYLTTGSAIRNSSLQQAPANFNISGNGVVGGNIGIGTPIPSTRLEVVDPLRQMRFGPTTNDDGGYLVSTNPSQAIVAGGARYDGGAGWNARDTTASIAAFQGGETAFFSNTNLVPGTPFTPTERMKIDANGNVRQGRAGGGLVKAMIYIDSNGAILRCYNGITGVSGGPGATCGFATSHFSTGGYNIDFGFQISDRFYAVTLSGMNLTPFMKSYLFYPNATNVLTIYTFDINVQCCNGFSDVPFMVFVY